MALGKPFLNILIDDHEKSIHMEQLQDLAVWKAHVVPYLKDYFQLLTLMGNHTAASPLKLLIDKVEK